MTTFLDLELSNQRYANFEKLKKEMRKKLSKQEFDLVYGAL